jgi:histidine ammonia-lyase
MNSIFLDGQSLTIPLLAEIAYGRKSAKIAPTAKLRMRKSRKLVERWVERGERIYGVTTGFGEFANVHIDKDKLEALQENLILSHAAGAGDPLPPEIVRAMMALRINALAKGFSGIRVETVEQLAALLELDILPVIPSQGSVGASGDLVQLSHLTLPLLGRGRVYQVDPESGERRIYDAEPVLRRHGLKPITLTAKEGLALINGTQMMTSFAALAVERASLLSRLSDVIAAISVEALRGSDTAFDPRIHRLRPYVGQQAVASNLRKMMAKSRLREAHRKDDTRVQDAYSIRCIPQVHGASRDAIAYVYDKVAIEINSANDNPLIFPDDEEHLEGGNFHGQPMALAMDFLAIALSELANISERRTERLVNGSLSGLPRFLTQHGGLNSGLMIAQYTAASIVSENKVLCHPASVDSIPTSANQEDHNSMGSISAQKAWKVLHNAETVLAIELICACQGLDFARTLHSKKPLIAGHGTEAAYSVVRSHIPYLDADRIIYYDILAALEIVRSGKIAEAVERKTGKLL